MGYDNDQNRKGSNSFGKNPTIKSPYNFVPLSDTVVFPDWAKDVSCDIPFEDGISGKIELEIKLESDAYIRNGGKWDEKERKNDNSPCQKFFTAKVNGEDKYIIPGTSFKGMIRNVLEIASFGKMQRVNDDRYSVRDLNNQKLYTGRLTERTKSGAIRAKAEAGWLSRNGENWYITPCDYARIEQEKLDRYFGTRREISVDKYEHYKKSLDIWFEPVDAADHKHSRGLWMNYKKVEEFSEQKKNPNQIKGRLVFTGQPSARDGKPGKKHMEFIFYNEKNEKIDVTELKKDFEFIHSDNNEKPNKEWGYWKTKLENGERVPVFFLDEGDYGFSFGLAMMFRLPYDYSVGDTVFHTSENHSSNKPDLSDIIFGYVNGNNSALRGRVQFSHLVSEKAEARTEIFKPILGGPKPSYYPNYIVQRNVSADGYKTFMDEDAEISGWKRYPSEKNMQIDWHPKLPVNKEGKENDDVATKLIPLKEGSTFKGSFRFFNLRPVELGAVLWALNFGGNKNCQHKIGMGKPLGLGRISIAVKCDGIDCKGAADAFEKYMAENVPDWKNSEQIKELIAMADVNLCLSPALRGYPELAKKNPADPKRTINEFVQYKKDRQRLEPYSKNAKEVK